MKTPNTPIYTLIYLMKIVKDDIIRPQIVDKDIFPFLSVRHSINEIVDLLNIFSFVR